MTSVPLLLSRRGAGRGPVVPLKAPASVAVVEGLAEGEHVIARCGERSVLLRENGRHSLPDPIAGGSSVRAELIGDESCVNVWLETL